MDILKINFKDFWPGFKNLDNYFYNLLSKYFNIEISETPDFLFYSCYGNSYLKYNCIRIFYTAENLRPDFSGCDFAMTFDYLEDTRHFRLPLYAFYIDQLDKWNDLQKVKSRDLATKSWLQKPKFCSMVVSNSLSKKRIEFYKKLSRYKHVDSGGKVLNNVGGPVADKLAFISEYKFVIAFENSSYPGYTTEKILDPFLVSSIPVYWGNPFVGKDFNKRAFLNYSDFNSEDELIDKMLSIEKDPESAIGILQEPVFPENSLPDCINEINVISFLKNIIKNRNKIMPVALSSLKYLHTYNRKKLILRHYFKGSLKMNFR